jgi:hypothetical protein
VCRNPEDKLIRHRACSLRDTAYTLIKAEMDTDFEDECREISRLRREREDKGKTDSVDTSPQLTSDKGSQEETKTGSVQHNVNNVKQCNSEPSQANIKRRRLQTLLHTTSLTSKSRIRKRSSWAKGFLKKKKPLKTNTSLHNQKSVTSPLCDGLEVSVSGDVSSTKDVDSADSTSVTSASAGGGENNNNSSSGGGGGGKHAASSPLEKEMLKKSRSCDTPVLSRRGGRTRLSSETSPTTACDVVDTATLQNVVEQLVNNTDKYTVDQLLKLYSRLDRIVFNYKHVVDRRPVVEVCSPLTPTPMYPVCFHVHDVVCCCCCLTGVAEVD